MTTSKSPVRFVDGAHILMSDGWVVRAVARPELVPLMPPLPRAVCETTSLTPRARSCCKPRPRVRASSCSSKLAARRAKQRWSALVSGSTSRLARAMRGRLGDAHWAAFMRHANRQYICTSTMSGPCISHARGGARSCRSGRNPGTMASTAARSAMRSSAWQTTMRTARAA